MKQTLYKVDSKGKVREWTIEVEDDRYRVITGLVDGKKVTSEWTTTEPKNVGRSNETSPSEQAMAEAVSEIQSKRDEFYHDTIDDAQTITKDFEPMLAKKYESWSNPVWTQPKLDGIRCNVSARGAWSRGQKEFVTIPHIINSLKDVFKVYSKLVFDGELYNHEYKDDFNTITSLVKKTKPSPEDIILSREKIQYHIYDCYFGDDRPFHERAAFLESLLDSYTTPSCLVYVPTFYVTTEDELDDLYADWTAEGYEGQMIRINHSPYEQKRSKFLLKRKPFYDLGGNEAEFQIIRIDQGKGNWTGMAKAVYCINDKGDEFKGTLKGNQEYCTKVWKDKEKYTGKLATIRYLNYTPRGVPRCGIVIELNRGQY